MLVQVSCILDLLKLNLMELVSGSCIQIKDIVQGLKL